MSRRHVTLARRVAPIVVLLAAAASSALAAQSMPGTVAKNAARRAVAATNAQIAAEQNTGDAAPTRVASVPRPASSSAESPKAAPAPRGRPDTRAVAPRKTRDTVVVRKANADGDGSTSISEHSGKNEISLMREEFTYEPDGRRDPFVSLITSGELRPMISDLKLVTVIYDPGGRSVAILRDLSTKEQYRIKTGQTLGRMHVARIDPKAVTFTLDEFGYSRQETLALNDSTRARSQ